jgi:hypothetical protein
MALRSTQDSDFGIVGVNGHGLGFTSASTSNSVTRRYSRCCTGLFFGDGNAGIVHICAVSRWKHVFVSAGSWYYSEHSRGLIEALNPTHGAFVQHFSQGGGGGFWNVGDRCADSQHMAIFDFPSNSSW